MTKIDMKVIAIMNKERQNGNIELRDIGLCSAPSSSSLASVTLASQQKGMLLSENKTKNVKTTQISDSVASVSNRVRNPPQLFDDRGSRHGSVERTRSPHSEIFSKPTKDNGLNQAKNVRKRALTIIGDFDSPRAKTVASINLNKPPSSTETLKVRRPSSVRSQVQNTQQCFDDRETVGTIVDRRSEITSKLMKVYGLNQSENSHNRFSTDIGGVDPPRMKTIASDNTLASAQTSATGSKRLQSQNRADLEGDDADPLPLNQKSFSVVSRYDSRQVSTEYFEDDGGETQLPGEIGPGNGLSFLPISRQSDESWAGNISSANSSDEEDSQYEETVNRIARARELEKSGQRDPSTGSQYEEMVNRITRTRKLEKSAGRDTSTGSQYEETVSRIFRTRELERSTGSDPSIRSAQKVRVNNNVPGYASRAVRRAPSDENIDAYDSGRENGANKEPSRGNGRGKGRGGSRGRARQQHQERRPSQPLSTLADNSIKLQQEGTDILHEVKRQNDVIIEQNKELIRSSKTIALYNRGILSLLREQAEQAQ